MEPCAAALGPALAGSFCGFARATEGFIGAAIVHMVLDS